MYSFSLFLILIKYNYHINLPRTYKNVICVEMKSATLPNVTNINLEPYLVFDIDELNFPEEIAKIVTIPEVVTNVNIEFDFQEIQEPVMTNSGKLNILIK